MNRLDNITPLFTEVEGNRAQEILTDILIVDIREVIGSEIAEENLVSLDLTTTAKTRTYRVPFDVKSVVFSSVSQTTMQGIQYTHSLTITKAGTSAIPGQLASDASKNRYFVFFKTNAQQWYLLPTYNGARVLISSEKFPNKSTIRMGGQSLRARVKVDESLLETILEP